jgi:outer membrane protein assembly factor BamB
MPSDCDKLFALDRRTGELLWESPRKPAADDDPAQYCLGVLDDGLFVAGHKSVRRYDLTKDGRLMWEAKLEPSFGHGVLTADAIYMPVGETVARIDPQTGKRTAQVGVFSPSKEPAGNLFSDGKRLLAVGLARAYSLQDLQSRLAGLGERIAAGDSQAQLQRMRLRLRAQEHDNALADLKEASERLVKQNGGIHANRTLFDGIGELDLVNRDPKLTLSLLVDSQSRLTPEVQSTAEKSNLEQLLGQRDGIVLGALRKIKADSTPAAAEQVLAVAAIVEKPNLLAAAREALKVTAAEANADLLRQAVASENPRQRIVAMASLTKALGDAASEPLLVGLLDDAQPEVQLGAALALSDRGDRRALTALGKLLDAEDLQIRSRASVALRALTGQKFKYMAYEKPENRTAAAQQWRDWIAGEGQTAKLNFPIADSRSMLGRTLIAVYAQNRVLEIDHDRKTTWEINNIAQPWGVEGLANGHRLVSSLSGQFVVEYDESGKECWRKDGLPGNVAHAHRLEDGNTLLAIANLNKVMEIDAEGKTVWEATVEGYPQDARRLDNGNTLIPLQQAQKVVEIDRSGKVIWEATNMQGPFSARRLDNGNTLIAQSGAGQVVEVDRDNKVVWRQQGLSSPYDAQRLDNGNTLITDTAGYREVDADNKVIWQENLNGVLRIDRY